jgi:hypothetical protein
MKQIVFIIITLFISNAIHSQVKFDNLLKAYHKNTLSESLKAIKSIPTFQLTDSLVTDTIRGEIPEGQITAYSNHDRTEVTLSFKSEKLYNRLYSDLSSRFNYTTNYARGSRKLNIGRSMTSFSNYQGVKIGSLHVLLVILSDMTTGKVVGYELTLYPYYED